MNLKMIAAAALAAALSCPASVSAQEKPSRFVGFFQNLKKALEKSAVAGERKKGRAVAAVRGAGQKSELSDPNEPTLKGDAKSARARRRAELDAEFEKAVDLALAGKNDEALSALTEFKAKHPKTRIEDVDKAIAELQAQKAAPAAEAAPAAQ